MFYLRKAGQEDRKWINTCNLRLSGKPIHQMDDYFILLSLPDQKPIGMLAIELHDEVAYLHSLRFTNGLPTMEQLGGLFDHLMLYCRKQGKKQVCLVVPPSSKWMLDLGFIRLDKVPASVENSSHYQQVAANGMLLSYSLPF